MLIIKPKQLGRVSVPQETANEEKRTCRRFGPCGIGQQLLLLNSFYFERRYYLPIKSVKRIFKRVAMSKGGFTGKGMFASIPYLVVEYDNGQVKQCNFKREEDVDNFLDAFGRICPDIPRHSVEAERKLKKKAEEQEARYLKELTPTAQDAWDRLERAKAFLVSNSGPVNRLARAAKNKRRNDQANPAYKWVALAIVIAGLAAAAYGVYALVTHDTSGIYWTLLGLAAVFLFSAAHVLPTAKNNRRAIDGEWERARDAMEKLVGEHFPVPGRYAHPMTLDRMIRIIREGSAQTIDEAFEVMKKELKALNSSVQVEQEEYDEVVTIKPMFLLCDYQ